MRVTLALRPDEPVLLSLLALMLLQHSRRDARVADDGTLVLLPDQDRTRWHHDEVEEGVALLGGCSPRPIRWSSPTGSSGLIAAEHALAPTAADTRWVRHRRGVRRPRPGQPLARGAPRRRRGTRRARRPARRPRAGLDALAGLDEEMPGTHRVPAVRGGLLARLGETAPAADAYDLAISRCRNAVERSHLESRRASLPGN